MKTFLIFVFVCAAGMALLANTERVHQVEIAALQKIQSATRPLAETGSPLSVIAVPAYDYVETNPRRVEAVPVVFVVR